MKEELSLYYDRLLPEDSKSLKHIRDCPVCQARLADYAFLDSSLKTALENSVGAGFEERSLANFKRKLSEKKTKIIPFPMLMLRVASLVFALSSLVFFIHETVSEPKDSASQIGVSPDQNLSAGSREKSISGGTVKSQASANNPAERHAEERPVAKNSSGSGEVSYGNMRPASAGNSGQDSFTFSHVPTQQPAEIPKIVHHVWSVRDLNEAKAKLAKAVESGKDNGKNCVRSRRLGNRSERFAIGRLEKKKLVNLVKTLSNDGFTLMSPVEPQPESREFQGNANEPVRYYFELVKL